MTYCPLCDSAAVFDHRTSLGQREFGVAGLRIKSPTCRVLAENPELAGQHLPDTPIDAATWRMIGLTMTKPDGGRLDMEFIRSPEWMDETGARSVGDTIPSTRSRLPSRHFTAYNNA